MIPDAPLVSPMIGNPKQVEYLLEIARKIREEGDSFVVIAQAASHESATWDPDLRERTSEALRRLGSRLVREAERVP